MLLVLKGNKEQAGQGQMDRQTPQVTTIPLWPSLAEGQKLPCPHTYSYNVHVCCHVGKPTLHHEGLYWGFVFSYVAFFFFSPVTNSVANMDFTVNIHKHWAHFIDSTKIYCEPHVQFCFRHLTKLIAVLRSSVIMSDVSANECLWDFYFVPATSLRAHGSVHASTVGWSSPLDMPEDDLGDRIQYTAAVGHPSEIMS